LTGFSLLPAQRALLEIPHDQATDIALYQGGVGSGKTTAGVLLGYLLSKRYPKSRGLVGASTYTLLRDTTRERWRELVPASDIARWRNEPDNLVLKNGSQIWFRHLSDPGRLSSMEFNWIHVEEGSQTSEETFRTLLMRLRYGGFVTPNGSKPRWRLFITTNPEEEVGYLYRTFVAPETPRENFRFIRAATGENTHLLEKKPDYLDLLRGLMDESYARIYLEGHTGSLLRGRVYRNFRRELDVSPDIAYDPARPLHLSFDFNVDFMAALAIQEASMDETRVVDEIVIREGSETAELCRAILSRYGRHQSGLVIHGDATGFSRHHRTPQTDYTIIRSVLGGLPGFRLKVRPNSANPSIRDRVNAVNFRFENALGKRRLKLSPRCVYLIESLEQTRYVEGGFEKEKIRDPKDRRSTIDHCGDALDYYIFDEHPFRREQLCSVTYL